MTQIRGLALHLIQPYQLASAHLLSLSRSLSRTFLSSSRSTLLPHLVSSTNWLGVQSILVSRSLMKMLKGLAPILSLGPFVTGHQLDATPFSTSLWAWPPRQFFTQQRSQPFIPWETSSSRRMPREMVSKALLNSR